MHSSVTIRPSDHVLPRPNASRTWKKKKKKEIAGMSIKLYPIGHLLVGSHRILSLTVTHEFLIGSRTLVLIFDPQESPLEASIVLHPLVWYLGVSYAKLDWPVSLYTRRYLYMANWEYMVSCVGVCWTPPKPIIVPLGGTTQPIPIQLMGYTTWGHISHAKRLRSVRTDRDLWSSHVTIDTVQTTSSLKTSLRYYVYGGDLLSS